MLKGLLHRLGRHRRINIPVLGPGGSQNVPNNDTPVTRRLLTGEKDAPIQLPPNLLSHLAIFDDGHVLVSERLRGDALVRHALEAARGMVPEGTIHEEIAAPVQIANLYGNSKDGSNEVTAALAMFVYLVESAAQAKANEIIAIMDADHASVVMMKNSRKVLIPAAGMTRSEAKMLFNVAFNNSDQGDKHPQFEQALDATITNKQLLPEGVQGLRLHWEPEAEGTVMNIRLAYRDTGGRLRGLEALKQPREVVNRLQVAIQSSGGMIVIAAQPEQGKSTSLTRLLEAKAEIIEKNGEHPIIWCFEQPVEMLTRPMLFGDLGRFIERGSALVDAVLSRVARLACNAVKLQETRDPEHAEIIFGLANMGIFAASTVHTPEVVDVPARFIDLRVDPLQAYNAKRYILLIAQRLVPVLCPHCAVPAATAMRNQDHLAALVAGYHHAGIDLPGAKVAGPGCSNCKADFGLPGYLDRQLLMETYRPTQTFMEHLRDGRVLDARRAFLKETNGHSLRLVALQEARRGRLSITDLQEIADPVQLREDLDLMGISNTTIREVA